MKTTLIIFLFLTSILIYFAIFYKIKIKLNIKIDNNLLILNGRFLRKNVTKEFEIIAEEIIEDIKELIIKHKRIDKIKIKELSIMEMGEILQLIEIKKLDIFLKVGSPFISSTIFLVIVLSTLIPVIYEKTDNRNGKLFYNVEPNFNKFQLAGDINLDLKITLLNIWLIICYLKKKNNKQIKRRSRYEQSSYRGFNEYGYE